MSDPPFFKHPGTYVRHLGRGLYGSVCEIEYQGRLCALKYGSSRTIRDEAKVIQALGEHPNVVRMLESGVYEHEKYTRTWWIVMEKFDENLLESFKRRKIKPEHIKTMFRHVLEALLYIQGKGYNHRDCHMGNIGVKWDTPTQPRFILCDFGFAETYREGVGIIPGLSNITDFDHFLRAVMQYLPFLHSVQQDLENMIRSLAIQATTKNSLRVLAHVLLELASQDVLQSVIGEAIGEKMIDSLRLILAVKAQQTGQTLASVCRELLERKEKMPAGMFTYGVLESVMAMFEWAGYIDNPEIKHVVSEENSWFIRRQVEGPVPELLQRLLSM